MSQSFIPALALGVLCLVSCQKETTTAPSATLEGNWRLVQRQCYCVASPLPDETLTFTATTFVFYRLGPQPVPFASGTYRFATVALCSLPASTAGLRFTNTMSPGGLREAQFTFQADTLVLNYGSPCDAPVDTYVRLP